jgi:hypothetical protein
MQSMAVAPMPVASLRPYSQNARIHSKKQIRQIADSIQKFGFTNPVLISDEEEIIVAHDNGFHLVRVKPGSLSRGADRHSTESRSRYVLQAATKGTNSGANRFGEND